MSKQVKYNANQFETNSFENKGRFLKSLMDWYILKPELLRKRREQFLKN